MDVDVLGHCRHTNDMKGFVCIKPSMSYKQKYFVLAHEAGHLFYMKKGKMFNWSKKARTEKQANFFALQLLRLKGIDKDEYWEVYNKAVKRGINRKSWFEL